jgi:hypothetical protein
MTKEELIHFLKPFSDEIKIVCDFHLGLTTFKPEYEIRKHPYRTQDGTLIESGEGIVVLRNHEFK